MTTELSVYVRSYFERRNIGERHFIARNYKRTLHKSLCRIKRGKAGSAALNRNSAKLKAVSVGASAVSRRIDDKRNVAGMEHIHNIGTLSGELIYGLRIYACLKQSLTRSRSSIELKLRILKCLKHLTDLSLVLIADGDNNLAVLRKRNSAAVECL